VSSRTEGGSKVTLDLDKSSRDFPEFSLAKHKNAVQEYDF
jgi:hypothetical protein